MSVHFNDAFALAIRSTYSEILPSEPKVRLIRDIFGRIRFAVNKERSDYPAAALEFLSHASTQLGAYGAANAVLFKDDFADPSAVFADPAWHTVVINGLEEGEAPSREYEVELLDRQITGQDWLDTTGPGELLAPRVVFYGLKGGVGRSTALALLSYRLAREGKNVLLLDLDLESPGLSGLLLPRDRGAEFGIVDWFIEDAVGQGQEIMKDLVADSPLASTTTGRIRVAAAMGNDESSYLPKLARVYAELPSELGPQRFADRLKRLVRHLEAQEKPDVVLIDSRAGLHDIAAVAITDLASIALLFASDTAQTWQGYEQLFANWQRIPAALRQVRNRIAMVQALFPESDQASKAQSFVQNAYELFLTYVYDQVPASANDSAKGPPAYDEVFSFDLNDEDAPHFPLRIRWNARFQEFDPLLTSVKGGLDNSDIELAYGPFFKEVLFAISESKLAE